MTNNKEIRVFRKTTEIAPGWTIIVNPKQPFKNISPGSTSKHEALHAVAALLTGTHVHEASRIPGPGYLGITKLGEFNAISFMAAHAMGCDGTGHDVSVVKRLGHNPGSVAAQARSLLADKQEEIHAVSSLIEIKGTITGDEAQNAIKDVENPEAEIFLQGPNGEKRHFVSKTRKGQGHLITLGLLENKLDDKTKKQTSDKTKEKTSLKPLPNDNIRSIAGRRQQLIAA